ncbi:MAG: hypothetical protein QM757_36290 [Paludibaculum sp.]
MKRRRMLRHCRARSHARRQDEFFEIFCRYGARDFRDIGHKAIYVANSFRTLEVIGWQHAEPVLRSLAYALLEREARRKTLRKADLVPDRPFRQNLETIRTSGMDCWRATECRCDEGNARNAPHRIISDATSWRGAVAQCEVWHRSPSSMHSTMARVNYSCARRGLFRCMR